MRSSTSHGFVFQQIIKKGVDIHIETEHMCEFLVLFPWIFPSTVIDVSLLCLTTPEKMADSRMKQIVVLVSKMEYEEDQSIEKMNCRGGCENALDVVVSKQAFCDSKSSIFEWV
ncbi:hypothetical protein V6N13_089958 [Hibiscus sabdariffa]